MFLDHRIAGLNKRQRIIIISFILFMISLGIVATIVTTVLETARLRSAYEEEAMSVCNATNQDFYMCPSNSTEAVTSGAASAKIIKMAGRLGVGTQILFIFAALGLLDLLELMQEWVILGVLLLGMAMSDILQRVSGD
jgi:hypothetical protein